MEFPVSIGYNSAVIERLRNREVPFPHERVQQLGVFEKDLLSFMRTGNRYDFYRMPSVLHVAGIEAYFNWLGALTYEDPQKAERATAVHIDGRNKWPRIVYPTNPNVGDSESTTLVYSLKPDRFLPAVLVHTHPSGITFSPQDLSGFGKSFIAYAVVTPRENHLLIRTAQTRFSSKDETPEKLRDENDTLRRSRLVTLFGGEIDDFYYNHYYDGVEDMEKELIISSFPDYYARLEQILLLAKRCKIAFYYSAKDGNYTLVTDKKLEEERIRFKEAIESLQQNMQRLRSSEGEEKT